MDGTFSGSSIVHFKLPANLQNLAYLSLSAYNINIAKLVLPSTLTAMSNMQLRGYIGYFEVNSNIVIAPGYCYGSSIKGNSAYTIAIRYDQNVLTLSTTGGQGQYYNRHYYYVPDALLDEYKAASGWSNITSRIFPISELPTT